MVCFSVQEVAEIFQLGPVRRAISNTVVGISLTSAGEGSGYRQSMD